MSSKAVENYKKVEEYRAKNPGTKIQAALKHFGIYGSGYYKGRELVLKNAPVKPTRKPRMAVMEVPNLPEKKILAFYGSVNEIVKMFNEMGLL